MKSKQIKIKSEFNFFETYSSKVEVVGFRTSWISEFKEDMKNTYEPEKETEKKK